MSVSSKSSVTLVLIPTPGMGHLAPAMELAKLLVARDQRLAITVLLIKPPVTDVRLDSYTLSLKSDTSLLKAGITLIDISVEEPVLHKPGYLTHYMEFYKSIVKDAVEGLRLAGPVGGLILDLFCPAMFDVATDLGIPSYLFFTSGASLLTMTFHLRGLGVDVSKEYNVVRSPNTAIDFPGFQNRVPVGVWPGFFLLEHDGSGGFLRHVDTYRKARGILVNTFTELERDLIHSLAQDNQIPQVFPVGPLLNQASDDGNESSSVMRWLDAQPPRSVVFLCFGSRGCFDDTQVKEIAVGLERSGLRFLWSLRIQPENHGVGSIPLELDGHESVLPKGFIERTTGQGRVIGWPPQARVLGHVAVGVFVSHCGWNSTLESLWHSVPMIAWPIGAEQQLNAFLLVKELGLATEIKIDYRQDFGINMVVGATEIEAGIKNATESESGEIVRKKVKKMSEDARKAVKEGGSSYECVGNFIETVFDGLQKIS